MIVKVAKDFIFHRSKTGKLNIVSQYELFEFKPCLTICTATECKYDLYHHYASFLQD